VSLAESTASAQQPAGYHQAEPHRWISLGVKVMQATALGREGWLGGHNNTSQEHQAGRQGRKVHQSAQEAVVAAPLLAALPSSLASPVRHLKTEPVCCIAPSSFDANPIHCKPPFSPLLLPLLSDNLTCQALQSPPCLLHCRQPAQTHTEP
jgi:hypothetical protein